jgi:hypothetical protein
MQNLIKIKRRFTAMALLYAILAGLLIQGINEETSGMPTRNDGCTGVSIKEKL